MRNLLVTAAIGMCATTGLAQSQSQSEASRLLGEVIKTYASADAVSDTMTISYEMPGMPDEEVTGEILVDHASENARFEIQSTTITALDGKLYLEIADLKKKYLQVDITKDFSTTLSNLFGGSGAGLPFHFMINETSSIDDLTEALSNGAIANLELVGVESTKTDNGSNRRIVTMTGANEGELKIHIDPSTSLIVGSNVTFVTPMPGNPEGATITMTVAYEPTLHVKLPQPITFDPAGRTMVSSVMDLQPTPPTPLSVGDEVPDFTLVGNDGEEVTLSDLRGNVVVLDFWATWCPPCIMGLPHLQDFDEWAKENRDSVRVFAVNTFQREKTPEQRKEAATGFWKQKEFTMTTLLDLDSAVAGEFGIGSIPATIVIGPDGKISASHVGYDPNMVETLKKDVTAAMSKKTSAG